MKFQNLVFHLFRFSSLSISEQFFYRFLLTLQFAYYSSMKLLFSFLLLLCSSPLFSQGYAPLPLQNGAWLQGLFGLIGPMYQAQIPGTDTVLGGQTYKNFYPDDPIVSNWFALRETPDHKVFIQVNGGPNEFLLYDFNLNIGDTFLCEACEYLYAQTFDWILDSTNSVSYGGIQRMTYYFTSISPNYGGQQDVWIQGIGSTKGLSYAGLPNIPDNIHILGCFKENGEIVFTQPTGPPDPCGLLTNTPESKLGSIPFLQENNKLLIQNTSNSVWKAIVSDLLGRSVGTATEIRPNEKVQLSLINGINAVSIQKNNEVIWRKKFWTE